MTRSMPVMTRVSPKIKQKLRALAKQTDRSESYVVAEAIEAYVDLNAWQTAHVERSLAAVEKGESGIAHDRVVEWLKSWGTEQEIPPTRPIHRPKTR